MSDTRRKRSSGGQHGLTILVGMMLAACWLAPGMLVPALARAAAWRVPLEIRNGAGVTDTITFGIDRAGTPGVDPGLGEVELPPWPPSSLFEVRFLIPNTEGVKLDIRDSTATQRFHNIRWQAGTGGYPITVRWTRSALPYGSLFIMDGYGGGFIPPTDMHQTDSLVVPSSLSFVKLLKLDVTPSATVPPALEEIPATSVFLGQRFPEYHLDDYVADPDTPDEELFWSASGQQVLVVTIEERVLHVDAPPAWTGGENIHLLVRDPQGQTDETDVLFTVKPGGLPGWTIPFEVRNGVGTAKIASLGVHPQATDGIDATLGELSLPPWPPSEVFESRFLLPDELTSSLLDLREGRELPTEYHLQWQAGQGGYPVTVEWPSDLPEGQFTVEDDLGGTFIPPLDMRDTTRIVIPADWYFITGLRIVAVPTVDTIPPAPVPVLQLETVQPWTSVSLTWSPSSDEHFAYYEVLFDTTGFTTEARWSWDWSEDAALVVPGTTTTTVQLPVPVEHYFFRIRAWDRFGNVSSLSTPLVDVGPREHLALPPLRLTAFPNPARGRVQLGLIADQAREADVAIYDVEGRRIRSWRGVSLVRGVATLSWDGCTANGEPAGSGVVFVEISAGGRTAGQRIAVLR